MILIVIGIQFIVATVTLLMYGNGHPLIQYIRSIHVGFQVIIISIVGFIIYAIPGYLLVISKSNKRNLIETIDSKSSRSNGNFACNVFDYFCI
ncbi:hypothetical protein MGH68_02820 [Erysipelothrix sp. D19-032]